MKLGIKLELAVKLLKKLGYRTADSWDVKRIVDKLKMLPEMVNLKGVKSPKARELIKKIGKATDIILKDNDGNPLTGSKTAGKAASKKAASKDKTTTESKTTKTKKKDTKKKDTKKKDTKDTKKKKGKSKTESEASPGKKKKGTTKKKDTKKKESKSVSADGSAGSNKDAFGCRLGTQSAKINAALDQKGKTAEVIAKAVKLSLQRVRNHLGTMIGWDFVEQTENGKYKIK